MKKSALKKYIREEIIKTLSEVTIVDKMTKTDEIPQIAKNEDKDEKTVTQAVNTAKETGKPVTIAEKDENINEENLDEGWKQALIGLGLTAATIAGIGKAYLPPSAEELKDRETLEKTVNLQKDALNNTSDQDVLKMVRSLEDFLNTSYIKFSPEQADRLGSEKMSSLMNQEARDVIENLLLKGNDKIKAGFVVKADGTLAWANPTKISAINEEDDVEAPVGDEEIQKKATKADIIIKTYKDLNQMLQRYKAAYDNAKNETDKKVAFEAYKKFSQGAEYQNAKKKYEALKTIKL